MECPKCHTIIKDNETVCPKCHKVLLLECPNCHSLEETPVCSKCGYKILVKCSKCGKINPSNIGTCVKCGFSTQSSLALQECESDELAYVIIKFNNLKKIRRLLKSKDLYEKFFYKLKNLMLAQVKNAEGLFITYDDTFVLNFNKELSFPTSANKAARFAIKFVNAFSQLNLNILEELRIPLGLTITIAQKSAEDLQKLHVYENNVKLLNIKKETKKYLRGTQVILDQFVWDEINKEYKTDSLYSMEENGKTTMFYELLLDSYIIPPDTEKDNTVVNAVQKNINKMANDDEKPDMYAFKVFDINAKCAFETSNSVSLVEKLYSMDLDKKAKILSLRSKAEYSADIAEVIKFYREKDFRTITITCTDSITYEPWGFFIRLFKAYYGLSFLNTNKTENINPKHLEVFKPIFDLCTGTPVQASSYEDARFTYVELWLKFMSIMSKTVIIVDGFQKLDDTSIQTLELYLENFKTIKPNFVFITDEKTAVHSKLKGLLRADNYTEIKLDKSSFSNCLSTIKLDASDFIGSFYFEKIQENFKGSYLYFKYAIKYLREAGVLIDFENKLLLKASKSVVVPSDLNGIYKARMKNIGKVSEISFIIAYLTLLYPSLDMLVFKLLGIKDIEKHAKTLSDLELLSIENDNLILNNYTIFSNIINSAIKKDAETMLANNIMTNIGTLLNDTYKAILTGKLDNYSEEYKILCSNADFALSSGDYDAYLKNCLGFLSLIESVESDVLQEEIETRKKEVYNSILQYLYHYAPEKIYFIENILLTDAINENDTEKIVRLSNMMLQGALISSNYTDAMGLLHNILSRMENPTLMVNGSINTKFLLLSLVNIEILYNIGKFKECIEVATEVLSVLKIEIIDKIKPAGFSTNSFVSHILDTMRLAAFAKLYLMEDNLDNFFDLIKITLDIEHPEKDCILAIRDFLAGKVYNTGVIEEYSPFSKMIFLILQEISTLQRTKDYKKFAQDIYQAKLLAEDVYQPEIKYFCDMLIAYAYFRLGFLEKAEHIYNDVLEKAEVSAIFNILNIARYFLAKLTKDSQKAMLLVNDALESIRKLDNQAVILYVLFEKLYIEMVQNNKHISIDIETEWQKISPYAESLKIILE